MGSSAPGAHQGLQFGVAVRQLDLQMHVERARALRFQGQALSLEPKDGSRVGPSRDRDGNPARKRLERHLRPQNRIGEFDRQIGMQVTALDAKTRMRPDDEAYTRIARLAAERIRLALTPQANHLTVLDIARQLDGYPPPIGKDRGDLGPGRGFLETDRQ